MVESLKEIDNIYDLMALCGAYFLRLDRNQPYDFSEFQDENYDDLYDAVEAYCCSKKDKGSGRAFAELKRYIVEFFKHGYDTEKCFAVIKYIDELIEAEVPSYLLENHNIVSYSYMNKKYYDEIRIIPKRKDSFFSRKAAEMKERDESRFDFFRNTRKCVCSALDGEMINYMIWDKEKIEKYPFTIYHFNEKHLITKHFLESKKLTFAIIPFLNTELDEIFKIRYGNKTFEIEYMESSIEKNLKERYKEIYEKCEQKDIDFLIFPEMLMTEDLH